MGTYIKTGQEIHKQGFSDYGSGEHQRIQKDMGAKWVSQEWLLKTIEKLNIAITNASYQEIPIYVDGKKEMHRGFLTFNAVSDMIWELKKEVEG